MRLEGKMFGSWTLDAATICGDKAMFCDLNDSFR